MSARVTSSSVHQCIQAAYLSLADEVGTAQLAGELGIDPSTVRRNKTSGEWFREIAGLIAYEIQTKGESRIISALADLSKDHVEGEAIAATGELITEIADDARVTAVAAKALEDGRISAAEARDIRLAIADRRKHEEKLLLDLEVIERGGR